MSRIHGQLSLLETISGNIDITPTLTGQISIPRGTAYNAEQQLDTPQYYIGAAAPLNTIGNNDDLYIQIINIFKKENNNWIELNNQENININSNFIYINN